MNSRYHPEDTDAVERLHARFMADNNLNDQLIEFQDKAYAMGRARGLKEALPAFDEAAERAAFEEWWSGFYRVPVENLPHARTKHGYVGQPTHQAWMSWLACARSKAGVE